MGDQVDQKFFLTFRRVFQQFNQTFSLLGAECEGGDTKCGTLGGMLAIGF